MNSAVFGNYGQTDIYSRSLQNIYINTLCDLVKPKEDATANLAPAARRRAVSIENNDVKALVSAQLEQTGKKLKRGKGDERTRAHYNYLYKTIDNL